MRAYHAVWCFYFLTKLTKLTKLTYCGFFVFLMQHQVRSTGKIEGMVRYNDVRLEQGGSMVGDIQKGAKMSLGGV